MSQLLLSPEGIKIIFGICIVMIDCFILRNTITGMPVKENITFNASS